MRDAHIARLAGRQFNRLSRAQLGALGLSPHAIAHRVAAGRLAIVDEGVFAVAPVLEHDDWGRWMAATLTAPGSVLSRTSAAHAWGLLGRGAEHETVTRPGSGGPRRHGSVLVFRSSTLEGDCTHLRGIPITTVPRTLLDLAPRAGERALARAVRESVRLRLTTVDAIADRLGASPGRRGSRRLALVLARYSGLPIERARSGAEVLALELLREAGFELPRLNVRIAGEEADLSWRGGRLILEVDGGPFHLDAGQDGTKQATWEAAGWRVLRLPSDDVYEAPERLISLARTANVPHYGA